MKYGICLWIALYTFQQHIYQEFIISQHRSSPPKVLLGKGVLKICSKFNGEYSCRNVMSIKPLCNFMEITIRHGCSPVKLLYIFRTPFYNNTSGRLLLIADSASRNFRDASEWLLTKYVFIFLADYFGIPEIDPFATRLNEQLHRNAFWM